MPKIARDFPWYDRRENGVYYAFWYDGIKRRTVRKSLRTECPKEAAAAFNAFINGPRPAFETDVIGVSDALDAYYVEHVMHKVVDKKRQEDIIHHLKSHFGNTPLAEIDIPASRVYAEARRQGLVGGGRRRKNAEASDATIRRELTVLKAAANHARRWKRISADDVPSLDMPKESRRKEPPWLRKTELETLFDAALDMAGDPNAGSAERDLYDFITLTYWTASRRRAIENLTVDQVDLESGILYLAADDEQKSNKRRPPVPIFPAMRPVLERRVADGFFRSDFYHSYSMLSKRLGFEGRHNPHVLRHSRVTHLLQDGKDIYDVARLAGDSPMTIDRVYGHHSPKTLADRLA